MTTRFRLTTEIQTPAIDGDWDGEWINSFSREYKTLGAAKTGAMRRRKNSEDIGFTISEECYADHYNNGHKHWAEVRYWRSCALTDECGFLEDWTESDIEV